MASGRFTKVGIERVMEMAFRRTYNGGSLPTNFYLALCTEADEPNSQTEKLSDLDEISAGNGYTSGGIAVAPNSTDFDVLAKDPSYPEVYIQIADKTFTASGGEIPAGGPAIRYAVLTDDNASVADREVLAFWDLESDRVIPDGEYLKLKDLELRWGTLA